MLYQAPLQSLIFYAAIPSHLLRQIWVRFGVMLLAQKRLSLLYKDAWSTSIWISLLCIVAEIKCYHVRLIFVTSTCRCIRDDILTFLEGSKGWPFDLITQSVNTVYENVTYMLWRCRTRVGHTGCKGKVRFDVENLSWFFSGHTILAIRKFKNFSSRHDLYEWLFA